MKNSYIYMIGEIIPKLLNFLLLPVMTRYLTPDDYGVIGYVDAIILFVLIFSVLALNTYILREYWQLDNEEEKKKLIGNFYLFLAVYNVGLFLVSFICLFFLFQYIDVQFEIIPILTLALLINFLEIFNLFPQIIYRLHEKALAYVYFLVSKTIFQFLAVLFFLEYFHDGPLSKYYGLFLVSLIYAAVSFIIVKNNSILIVNMKQLKDGLKFAFPLILVALSFCIVDISDRIIMEQYVSLSQVGIYSIAYAIGFSINVIIKGSYKAFEPLIFKNANQFDFLNIFSGIKNEYFAMVFVTCLLVILFSKELVVLMFNENYLEAHSLIPIIVLAAFAKGIYTIQALLLLINKKTKLLSKIMLLGAAINIGINLLFIEEFGSVAAALSTFASFTIMALIVHIKGFNYYAFSFLNEGKVYILLLLLCVIVYITYYHLSLPITMFGVISKMVVVVIAIFVISNVYDFSGTKNVSN